MPNLREMIDSKLVWEREFKQGEAVQKRHNMDISASSGNTSYINASSVPITTGKLVATTTWTSFPSGGLGGVSITTTPAIQPWAYEPNWRDLYAKAVEENKQLREKVETAPSVYDEEPRGRKFRDEE